MKDREHPHPACDARQHPLSTKPRVVNIGIETFYDALRAQQVDCVQIQWQPPHQLSRDIEDILDQYL